MPSGKIPHLCQMASREPFLLGGLWDTWHYGREDALSTFTVLTTLPNEVAATACQGKRLANPLLLDDR
jgi:putative SOS response-associated peptidase YedK